MCLVTLKLFYLMHPHNLAPLYAPYKNTTSRIFLNPLSTLYSLPMTRPCGYLVCILPNKMARLSVLVAPLMTQFTHFYSMLTSMHRFGPKCSPSPPSYSTDILAKPLTRSCLTHVSMVVLHLMTHSGFSVVFVNPAHIHCPVFSLFTLLTIVVTTATTHL
jgi:hypothetical protein